MCCWIFHARVQGLKRLAQSRVGLVHDRLVIAGAVEIGFEVAAGVWIHHRLQAGQCDLGDNAVDGEAGGVGPFQQQGGDGSGNAGLEDAGFWFFHDVLIEMAGFTSRPWLRVCLFSVLLLDSQAGVHTRSTSPTRRTADVFSPKRKPGRLALRFRRLLDFSCFYFVSGYWPISTP